MLEVQERDIAQRTHSGDFRGENSRGRLAIGAPGIVLAGSVIVFHHAVADDKLRIVEKREQLKFQRAAVQHKRVVRASAAGDHLVHDAATRTGKFIFCALADFGEFNGIE